MAAAKPPTVTLDYPGKLASVFVITTLVRGRALVF
jgi:hypothetical protein